MTSQPLLIEAGGARQLIVWDTTSVTSLNPVTGAIYWTQPFRSRNAINFAMAHSGARLLMSTFEDGPLMLELDQQRPGARVLWKGQSASEIDTDKLHSSLSTPIIDGDYIYGICSYGQLRALDARTGERIWESQAATVERARWTSAQLVQHGDRVFITNDRGELILARLTPDRVPGNQPDAAHQADLGSARPLSQAGGGELVAPRVREQAHLRAERRGADRGHARRGRLSLTLVGGRAIIAGVGDPCPLWPGVSS